MKQIIYIHGGDCFATEEDFLEALKTRDYNPFLEKKKRISRLTAQLQDKYQIMKPEMPNKRNAKYKEWKVRFERHFPFINDEELIVIGHSLGTIFLAKYLTENNFPKKISQLHLVSPVFDNKELPSGDNNLADFLFDTSKIPTLQDKADQIFIYHSTDDEVVPYSHSTKYLSLLPNAKLTTFTDRGHINQETFPELLANIDS